VQAEGKVNKVPDKDTVFNRFSSVIKKEISTWIKRFW